MPDSPVRRWLMPAARHLEADLLATREALQHWKSAAAGARVSARDAHRRIPATESLQVLLPARVASARRRASSPAARARHAAWMQHVDAYRHAVEVARQGADAGIAVELGGITWCAPASARQPDRAERLRAQGLPLRALLQTREVSVGPIMLDVGANIGRTSLLRTVLGDCGVAYAAEPDPGNFESLVRTLIINGLSGLVLPEQCAIGSADGEVTLRRGKYIGGHTIGAGGRKVRDAVAVPCRRLDSWVADRRIDLDAVHFVKVDVQGWEPHVLEGAPGVLACRHIAWQLEIDPPLLRAAGGSPEDLLARLAAHFTRFIDLHPAADGSRLRPVADLPEALGYLADGRGHKTDLVLVPA
ncbi:MAG: FkbM family methyltransferase [Vicinamibacterales bacterium]